MDKNLENDQPDIQFIRTGNEQEWHVYDESTDGPASLCGGPYPPDAELYGSTRPTGQMICPACSDLYMSLPGDGNSTMVSGIIVARALHARMKDAPTLASAISGDRQTELMAKTIKSASVVFAKILLDGGHAVDDVTKIVESALDTMIPTEAEFVEDRRRVAARAELEEKIRAMATDIVSQLFSKEDPLDLDIQMDLGIQTDSETDDEDVSSGAPVDE